MISKYLTINTFTAWSGIGRTKVYHLLGEGVLRAKKVGKRTLIDAEHAKAWLASLPAAEVNCGRKSAV